MKQCYTRTLLLALFTLIFYLPNPLKAQCLCSDGSPAITEQHTYSTTFSSNSTTNINMPKFNATTGTLICVNAKVYLTSIVRMRLENDEVFAIDYSVRYQRKDTFAGPGITPEVVGSKNKNYGPYQLEASDGNSFSGPDFVTIGPDTIYNLKLYEANTTDVVPYLGTGTIDFQYKSIVNTFAIGSDVYALAVTSQNKLDFTMTYSYCNTAVLPLNIKNFQAELNDNNNVNLSWIIQNENKNNNYEIEVSENGAQFYTIGSKPADAVTGKYDYQYHFDKPLAGIFYFRIKQLDGKSVRYSEIRNIRVGNGIYPKVNIYPNPVVQNINMEFDEPLTGEFNLQLSNQVGQVVYQRKMWLSNNKSIGIVVNDPPPPGIYYLKANQAGSSKVYSGKLLFRR
jgi:hypothetical protein